MKLLKTLSALPLLISPAIFAADYTCSTSGGTNCNATIPDLGIATSIIVPSDACPAGIADVDVDLNLSHTWIGDLIITLEAPDTQTSTLIDRPGEPVHSIFGCNDDDIQATFDDAATNPAEDQCPNTFSTPGISGTVSPATPLAALNASTVAGSWTLTINDLVGLDSGQLNDWTLSIECNDELVVSPTNIPIFSPLGLLAMLSGLFWFGRRRK